MEENISDTEFISTYLSLTLPFSCCQTPREVSIKSGHSQNSYPDSLSLRNRPL